jgi:uncharacterized delta-60 repeat protein
MFIQFKHLIWKASLLATVFSMLAFNIVLAASGDLDTTFSGDGKATSFANPSFPGRSDTAWSVAIQPDGKLVVAGSSYIPSTSTSDFGVVRHNSGGALDTTFSGDGRQITDFGAEDRAFEVALQSDGKIVVAGQTCINDICNVALTRYKAGGAPDTTFSGDGKQTSDFGGDDNGSYGGLAIQPDGKIVLAGYMWNGSNYDFAVYRFLSNGNLDTTFSGDGRQSIGFGPGRQDFATDLILQSDGKILVAGYSGDASYGHNNFAIVRLKAGGAIDTTFSADGKQMTDFVAEDFAYEVALQADGKIILAGERYAPSAALSAAALPRHKIDRKVVAAGKNFSRVVTSDAVAMARYTSDGSLDTTFNVSGKKLFNIVANADSWAEGLLVQADGKILVLGSTDNGAGNSNFGLVRLNSNGSFDTTFNTDGKVTVDFGSDEFAGDLALQGDGKYVLAGHTCSTQCDFALARILP